MNDAGTPYQTIHAAESLRLPGCVNEPDPRTTQTLAQHHADIDAIRLSNLVPEPVAIQFETARNLYLYAWHVYRFHMVAEMQAYAALELGLRRRLPARLPPKYQRPKADKPMLFGLLNYAIDQGLVRNECFRRWHEAGHRRAAERRSVERMQMMIDQQLDELVWDENEAIAITPEDQQWDLLEILRKGLPDARNEQAHGSTQLTRYVRGTIELVAEILNQVYSVNDLSPAKGPDSVK